MNPFTQHVDHWKPEVKEVLQSKVEELKMLGYSEVTTEEVWECLTAKVWKKDKNLRLHQVIQDIFHLSGSTYMSYLTVQAQAQEESDLFTQVEALNDL